MSNLAITLGGVVLPDQATLIEITTPNEADVRTLDGSLYTDFINNLRSWEISWEKLTKAEYDAIRQIFLDQYTNEAYPVLLIPFYEIGVPAKISLSPKDIRFDGECIRGFSITLKEQFAIITTPPSISDYYLETYRSTY